jgi:hypothetical protein
MLLLVFFVSVEAAADLSAPIALCAGGAEGAENRGGAGGCGIIICQW